MRIFRYPCAYIRKKGGLYVDKNKTSDLLIFVISAELVGVISGLFAGGPADLGSPFASPPLSPPPWLFPIVWTILYAVMGISAYLVYSSNADSALKKRALFIYGLQLFVNFWWSIAFFRFMSLPAAIIIVLALFILVAVMIAAFRGISRAAALINIPYLIWVGFASYLTIAAAVVS